MYQLNMTDYSFVSSVWKNTSIINGFFFLDSKNISKIVNNIKLNTLKNIQTNNLYKFTYNKDESVKFYPFLDISEKIDIDKHFFVYNVSFLKKDFDSYLTKIVQSPMNMSNPLWEIHVVKSDLENKAGIIVRMHHVIGDGSVFFNFIKSIFNPKKNNIKVINNNFFDLYKYIKIIKWCIKFVALKLANIFKKELVRNLPEKTYARKWEKDHSEKKIIQYKEMPYKSFKPLLNKFSINFQTLALYLYANTYKKLSQDLDGTLLAGMAINVKKHKYGTCVHTLLCDLHLDKDKSTKDHINLIKQSFNDEYNYFYKTKIKNIFLSIYYSPFKSTFKNAWKLFFPKSASTYLSVTNHKNMNLQILDAKLDNYYVIQPYPEIHGSSGISINMHRNNDYVYITAVGYPNRFLKSDQFLDELEKLVIKLGNENVND